MGVKGVGLIPVPIVGGAAQKVKERLADSRLAARRSLHSGITVEGGSVARAPRCQDRSEVKPVDSAVAVHIGCALA